MPSSYESWGRVATEAILNGIPVIAHPTEGLMENLGESGIFIDRDNTDAWVTEIKKLLKNSVYYKKQSDKCRLRYEDLKPEKQLEKFERFILNYVDHAENGI